MLRTASWLVQLPSRVERVGATELDQRRRGEVLRVVRHAPTARPAEALLRSGGLTHGLTTPRLRGLPLAETDFDDLYALHRDERVLAAFGADPLTAEETRAATTGRQTVFAPRGARG